jgi:hypothetical protein
MPRYEEESLCSQPSGEPELYEWELSDLSDLYMEPLEQVFRTDHSSVPPHMLFNICLKRTDLNTEEHSSPYFKKSLMEAIQAA